MNDIDSISTEIFDNVTWVPSDSINDYSQHVLRIKKIEWNDKNISKIPEQIGFLDSLHWLELENNLIDTIPGTIGSLLSLEYLRCHLHLYLINKIQSQNYHHLRLYSLIL